MATAPARSSEVISSPMRELSEYIESAIKNPLPDEVAERAKIHIVDTFAAMISGSRLLPGERAIAYTRQLGGVEEAGVIGTRIVTSAVNAALANGMFAHADETDDTHPPSRTHPGSGIVPAALAIGERNHCTGEELLRAIVLGYDICARLVLAMDEMAMRLAGYHIGTHGRTFGAAAAVGALLKLDAHQIRYLLSYAAQQASGLYTTPRDIEHVEKAYMAGKSAQAGVAAGLMVTSGFTGVEDVFSGQYNFFATYAPKADLSKLTKDLGTFHEVLRGGIKRWSAGGPMQGPLHVLLHLIEANSLTPERVRRIVVRMPHKEMETVSNREMPDICLEHLLAVMLVDGTVTFQSAHEYARMSDPAVVDARKKVQLVGDPQMTDKLRRWRCAMEIELTDGTTVAHQTMAAKGTFEDPMTRQEEDEKAIDLITPVLGAGRARRLLSALWELETMKDAFALRDLVAA